MDLIGYTGWTLDYIMWKISFKSLVLLISSLDSDMPIEIETNPMKLGSLGMDFKKVKK